MYFMSNILLFKIRLHKSKEQKALRSGTCCCRTWWEWHSRATLHQRRHIPATGVKLQQQKSIGAWIAANGPKCARNA